MSSNVVMVGALAGSGMTGLRREHFEKASRGTYPGGIDENLKAFAEGLRVRDEAQALKNVLKRKNA